MSREWLVLRKARIFADGGSPASVTTSVGPSSPGPMGPTPSGAGGDDGPWATIAAEGASPEGASPGGVLPGGVPLEGFPGLDALLSADGGLRVSGELAEDPSEIQDAEAISTPMTLGLPSAVKKMTPDEIAAAIDKAKRSGASWGLSALGVDPHRHSGQGVRVAVIDTGIEADHPAFTHLVAQNRLFQRDFTRKPGGEAVDGGVGDSVGHGTFCAGVIAGGTVEGVRLGVAPDIEALFVAKALGGERGILALIDAINWATMHRCDIITMSLNFRYVEHQIFLKEVRRLPEEAAISMALADFRENIRAFDAETTPLLVRRQRGRAPVIFGSTGNSSRRPRFTVDLESPSAANGVVSVGAVDDGLRVAEFSNTSPTYVGPGVDIVSAGLNGGLHADLGTSMACPFIAGLAALHLSEIRTADPRAPTEDLLNALDESAQNWRPLMGSTSKRDIGRGMPRAPGVTPPGS